MSASSLPEPAPSNAGLSEDGPRRSELAALYERVARTLERSAKLAEHHAERHRRNGRPHMADVELERATRAREGARRGRALARDFTERCDPEMNWGPSQG